MPTNALCTQLHQLNFDKEEDLRRILCQDKHTRLEGLCSEAVFMEDVVHGNLHPITSDFWFSRTRDGYFVRKILTGASAPLSELDYRILDGFAGIGSQAPTSVVWFSTEEKTFREVMHVKGSRYESFEGLGAVMLPSGPPQMPDEKDRLPHRQKKACDFLHRHGVLKDAAIKRLFANCWLGNNVWDIDAFTITSAGKVVALEVKQKYPTRMDSFGLNDGQSALFGFLLRWGMQIIHVVLRKPLNDPAISAIDLITEPEFVSRTAWYYTRYHPDKLQHAHAKAPAFTSITGSAPLAYSHIAMGHFAELKRLGVPSGDVRARLLAGLE